MCDRQERDHPNNHNKRSTHRSLPLKTTPLKQAPVTVATIG